MNTLLIYLALINLVAFAAMGIDKALAKTGGRRVPEKVLFILVLLLGGIGGMLGMRLFRHKTRHTYFKVGFPAITIAEYALLVYYLIKL